MSDLATNTTDSQMTEKAASPENSRLEFHKAFYDYLKHLSTLATGSIVLLAAILEKLFAQPSWKPLVVISIGGFLVTVVSSVLAYSLMVLNFPRPGINSKRWEGNVVFWAMVVTWISFVAGVFSLAVFIVRNLFV